MNTQQEYFSINETAAIMGCATQTVYSWVRRKQIPAQKMNHRVLIHRTTLNQMIAEKKNNEQE